MPTDLSRVLDIRRSVKPERPVPFTANNPETTPISGQYPIDRIECVLEFDYTVGGSASTLEPWAGLNLIQELQLKLDGKDVVFSAPGFLLQQISGMYSNKPLYASDPSTSVGTTTARYSFFIPVNTGPGYFSMLSMAGRTDLVLHVDWADVDAIATAGGTHSIANVSLKVNTVGLAGQAVNEPGGKLFGYPMHIVDVRTINVSTAQSDLTQNLPKGHLFSRLAFQCVSDGAKSDGILQEVTVKIGTTAIQSIEQTQMQVENYRRYDYASLPTGWSVLDLGDQDTPRGMRLEHLIGVTDPTINFDAILDVLHPGTTDTIYMVLDHYARPELLKAVA